MKNYDRYSVGYFPPATPHNEWVKKDHVEKAPTWCSVDLRDGNQALIVPMSLEEKVEFFQYLVKLVFKEIQVGFPAASETEYHFLRKLVDDNLIPDDVTIQVLTQSRKHIIKKTFDSLAGVKKAVVHLYNSTSLAQREQVFRKEKPEIIKITSRDPEPPSIDYVKVSGGMFLDMTIHDFDMVRYLAGCDATEVYVQSANLVDPAIGEAGDVDTAVITLQMENGAIAVIDNCRRASYGYDQRAEVFGSDGMAAISNDSQSSTVISNAEGVTGEKPMFFFLERYMDAYGKEVAAFIDAIVNDKETPLNVYDGLKPVLMGLAAKKSSEEHRPVKISEIME